MVKLQAKAKVNLFLKVLPKTAKETKHKIEGLFCLYSNLYDEILITPGKNKVCYLEHNKAIKIQNDKIIQAIHFMNKTFKLKVSLDVVVHKNIPLKSGLGGSATDVGAVLRWIINFYKLRLLPEHLKQIALELGSDVPFFVMDFHQAWVSDYGNAVRQIKNKLAKYVLFPTEQQVSTEDIFQLLEKDKTYKSRVDVKKCFTSLTLGTFDRNLVYNDLTPYILAHNKKIADAYNKMLATKNVVISGSGGSLVEVKPNVSF